jgi:hypothetical protein
MIAVAILAALCTPAFGQPARQEKDAEAAAKLEADRERALAAVEEILPEIESLRSIENRLYLQTLAVEILASRNPERAKRAVDGVAKSLAAAFARVDPYSNDGGGRWQSLYDLRYRVVMKIAERDPGLALDLLLSTRASAGSDVVAEMGGRESMMELQLAQRIAEKDPARAAETIERAIAEKRLDYTLFQALGSLREKDPELARRIAGKLVAELTLERLTEDMNVGQLATQLVQNEVMQLRVEKGGGLTIVSGPGGYYGTRLLDDVQLLALCDRFLDLASREPTSNGGTPLYLARSVLTALAASESPALGGRREAAQSRLAELEKLPMFKEYNRQSIVISSDDTIDDMLRKGASAPLETRDSFYSSAVYKAVGDGDEARALAIIDEHVASPRSRAMLRRYVEAARSDRAAGEQRFDEAVAALPESMSVEERVSRILQYAEAAKASSERADRERATSLLARAEATLDGERESQNVFALRLQIARAYVGIDSDRAFGIVERIVNRLNVLLDAASAVEGFSCNSNAFDEGELTVGMGSLLGSAVSVAAETLAALSAEDLERALDVAKRFERREARALATLHVAEALVKREEKPVASGAPESYSIRE